MLGKFYKITFCNKPLKGFKFRKCLAKTRQFLRRSLENILTTTQKFLTVFEIQALIRQLVINYILTFFVLTVGGLKILKKCILIKTVLETRFGKSSNNY